MIINHLLLIRILVIVLFMALVGLTFVHHHQKGQITAFIICEIGLAVVIAAASLFLGVW